MASTPVEIIAPPGLTLTALLFPEGSDDVANGAGDAAVEATNRKGLYLITVDEPLDGWHTLHLVDDISGTTIAVYFVLMANDETMKRAGDRDAGSDGGGGTAGPGSRSLEWATRSSGLPVSGVECWITSDAAGSVVVGGTYITDDSGIARVPGGTSLPMLDEDVVYYGWRDSHTVQFPENPIQFRYSSADNQWQIWNGTAYEEWT